MCKTVDINDWDFPIIVRTPDIEKDIERLLGKEVLEAYNLSVNDKSKNRIVRITEMLDFLGHIENIKLFLVSKDKPTFQKIDGQEYKKSNIIIDGIDYSGFQYDAEAFEYYSLLSIIDVCSPSQDAYLKLNDYIKTQIVNSNGIDKALKFFKLVKVQVVLKLISEYDNLYGLSRNFKAVFTEYISDELMNEIADNICVIKRRKTDYSKSEIESKITEWMNENSKNRCGKIASTLYTIRSKYTHENIRNFFPKPSSNIIRIKSNDVISLTSDILIVKNGYSIVKMLRKVIINRSIAILS